MSEREELIRASDDQIVRWLTDAGEFDLVALAYEAGRRRLRASVSNLTILLDSADLDIRLGAVEALGDIGDTGDDGAGRRILAMLDSDSDRSIRDTAAWTLGLLRYRPAIPKLAWMLSASEPTVRSCSAAALVAIGDKTAWPALRVQLAHETDEGVRRDLLAATEKLKPVGNPERDAARSQVSPQMLALAYPPNDPSAFPYDPSAFPLPRISSHG